MPRKFIKRFMPDHDVIKRQKALRVFGNVLYNPNLWCLNRRSAAGAFAVGLFMAFVPLPSQMIMAAGLAIVLGVNLPLSIALVWITNPITMPVIFYFTYKLGAWLMGTPAQSFHFELTWEFFTQSDEHHWATVLTRLRSLRGIGIVNWLLWDSRFVALLRCAQLAKTSHQ